MMILLQAILGSIKPKSLLPENITGLCCIDILKSILKAAILAWLQKLFDISLMETYKLYQS